MQSLALFFYPVVMIASFWGQFQQGLAASERVFALIDADPHVTQQANEDPGRLAGKISFEHVRFAYGEEVDETRNWVLPDFSLDIPAGETLAVVGHTGAGKSSLVQADHALLRVSGRAAI